MLISVVVIRLIFNIAPKTSFDRILRYFKRRAVMCKRKYDGHCLQMHTFRHGRYSSLLVIVPDSQKLYQNKGYPSRKHGHLPAMYHFGPV